MGEAGEPHRLDRCIEVCACCGSRAFLDGCEVCWWPGEGDLATARASFAALGAADPLHVGGPRRAWPDELPPTGRARHPLREALCHHALGTLDPATLPATTTAILAAGLDTPALVELAGAVGWDERDLDALFARALRETGVPAPAPEEAVLWLAQDVAVEMLDGTVSLAAGAARIARIHGALASGAPLRALDPFRYAASEGPQAGARGAAFARGLRAAAEDLAAARFGPITTWSLPHACAEMDRFVHDTAVPVTYLPKVREYALELTSHTALQLVSHCPWCGAALPFSLRDDLFARLDALGLDTDDPALPPAFRTDAWWRERE